MRKRERNQVASMGRKAVQLQFKKFCDEKQNNQRKFWRTSKPYINSRKCTINNSRIVLKYNNKLIADSQPVDSYQNQSYNQLHKKHTNFVSLENDILDTSKRYLGLFNNTKQLVATLPLLAR